MHADFPFPLQSLGLTDHISHVSFCFMSDETLGLNRKPYGKSCVSPGVTPELLQPAGFICFLFKLIKWLGSAHNWLSPSTSLVPSLQRSLSSKDFPINICAVLTISHHSDSTGLHQANSPHDTSAMRRKKETKKAVFGLNYECWVKMNIYLNADRLTTADNYNLCISEGSVSSNAPQVFWSGFMQQAVIQHKR